MTTRTTELSPYERNALLAIEAWRNPNRTWFDAARDRIDRSWNDLTDLARRVPGVEWTIENVVAGLLELTNEIVHDSVWTDGVLNEYRRAGIRIQSLDDVRTLDLESVDAALVDLDLKYQSLAGAEGTAAGLAGAAGIVPDLVALVAFNLRAVGEYATYCGFDVNQPQERIYALQLLDHVAGPSTGRKDFAFAPAVRMASRVARQQGMSAIEQMGFSEAVERLAGALGIHLTGAKMGQVVPIAGAVVGGTFNVLYTRRVCKTAFYLFRERFLIEKYGEDGSRAARP